MKLNEFLSICKEKCTSYSTFNRHERCYEYGAKPSEIPPYISCQWSTGGVRGGSCWEESDPQPYSSNDPEAELTDLDTILEHFVPNISFIQYKNLYNTLVKRDSFVDYEYYGNQTDYSLKIVDLKELYNYMEKKGWLEDEKQSA